MEETHDPRLGTVIERKGQTLKRIEDHDRIRWFRRLESEDQWARLHQWRAGRLEAQYRRDVAPDEQDRKVRV